MTLCHTIIAPVSSVNSTKGNVKAKVIQFFKPFGQIAIAASAAGLMILGVQQNVADNQTILPNQVVQTVPFAGVADPVSFNYQSANSATKQQEYLIQQRRFQALLVDHQQQIKFNTATDQVATVSVKPDTAHSESSVLEQKLEKVENLSK